MSQFHICDPVTKCHKEFITGKSNFVSNERRTSPTAFVSNANS